LRDFCPVKAIPLKRKFVGVSSSDHIELEGLEDIYEDLYPGWTVFANLLIARVKSLPCQWYHPFFFELARDYY